MTAVGVLMGIDYMGSAIAVVTKAIETGVSIYAHKMQSSKNFMVQKVPVFPSFFKTGNQNAII